MSKNSKQVINNDPSDEEKEQANESTVTATTDEESETESESDVEEVEAESKTKDKKQKETFEELVTKLETIQSKIKPIEKEIKDLEKEIFNKQKLKRELDRQQTNIFKILLKTHKDEVNKAIKSKPKRKGNVNGGFNKEQPVPATLCAFLEIPNDSCMARPKVMSALNNKFTALGLKKGQITKIDKNAAKALQLGKEYYGREIKFTEFQSFLASFYAKKETTDIEV
jgi:hypothetical protein